MKVLLFGAGGQIGQRLAQLLPALGTLVACDQAEADLSRPDSVRALLDRERPQLIVNAAAYTAVDQAESDAEVARQVNAESPRVMAEAARRSGALLVHYSTDYVFDGEADRPYTEESPTRPLSVYGVTKLAGEQAVRESGADHLILRTAWLYSNRGRNFFKTMLRLAGERDELRVVGDQIGSPTYADWVAETTLAMIQGLLADGAGRSRRVGTYHVVCAGQTSWHGFAQRIVELTGLAARVRVTPITTAEYPTPAQRPAYSVLSCAKLKREFGIVPPDWQQGLARCLAERES